MIGRAALREPFVFKKISMELTGGTFEPSKKDIGKYFKEYYDSIKGNPNSKFIIHKLRTMGSWLSHGFDNGVKFRRKLSTFEDEKSFLSAVAEFFDLDLI